jgi:hypothetical protein
MPARALSNWVYTTVPTGRSTSAAHIRCRKETGPRTSSLAKDDWSKRPAASAVARHSASMAGDHTCPAQPAGRGAEGTKPGGAPNQLTRSQPAFSPSAAPSGSSRGQVAERRNGRPADHSV